MSEVTCCYMSEWVDDRGQLKMQSVMSLAIDLI